MLKYLLFFFIAAVFSFILTPIVRKIAIKLNIMDTPSSRKIHPTPIPLLGGIPIFLSFNLVIILGFLLNNIYLKKAFLENWPTLVLCQMIILLIGIYDDIKRLPPRTKFLFQIFTGELLIASGFIIEAITNPFNGNVVHFGLLSIPITILWVVGITNALNLVDGLDGLATGIAIVAGITTFGISFFHQEIGIAFASMVFVGSMLGFLKYNFFPAKIFLGDSGSLYLGFILALLSIKGSYKGAVLLTVLAPILILGFPIMDTLLTMIRRFLRSINVIEYSNRKKKFRAIFFKSFSLFEADSDHIHHRLIKLGFSQRKAVIVLYAICLILSGLALMSVILKNFNVSIFLTAILISLFIGIRSLKYQELRILKSGILLPIFNFSIIGNIFFSGFIDLVFISLSYYLSFVFLLKDFSMETKKFFILTLPLVLIIKFVSFYIHGFYKIIWKQASLKDVAKIVTSTFTGSLISSFFLIMIFSLNSFPSPIIFILDFYLLLTFIAGVKMSYRILDNFYMRTVKKKEKKVLLYGAGYKGVLLRQEILRNPNLLFKCEGFIDDDITMKGKILHGSFVLGTLKDLENILKQRHISEIFLTTNKINASKIKKLTLLCNNKKIVIKKFELKLEPLIDSSYSNKKQKI